jgi:hypothetical protein
VGERWGEGSGGKKFNYFGSFLCNQVSCWPDHMSQRGEERKGKERKGKERREWRNRGVLVGHEHVEWGEMGEGTRD